MTAVSDGTGRGVLESPQHIVEGIILRRLRAKRIEGYTLEMSKEIVAALSAAPVAQEPVARLVPIKNLVAMLALLPPAPVDIPPSWFPVGSSGWLLACRPAIRIAPAASHRRKSTQCDGREEPLAAANQPPQHLPAGFGLAQ